MSGAILPTPAIAFQVSHLEPPDPYLNPRPGATFNQNVPRSQRVEDGLLAPHSISINVQVVQDTAKATVTQYFDNATSRTIENGTYQFPLPHGSTVVGFNCRIGTNRVLRGQVKPRETAQEEFNRAVRRGHTAGLVEQHSLEIFSTVIGNIPPSTKLEAELSYIFLLKHSSASSVDTMVLTIPTYIAPRYGHPGFPMGEIGAQHDRKLSVDVDVLNRNEIINVECETHDIEVVRQRNKQQYQRWVDFIERDGAMSSKSAQVRFSSLGLDSDFMLRILTCPLQNSEQLQGSLETHPSLEGHSALMIEIPPKLMLREQTSMDCGELIFLADRSYSMYDKISGLRSALEFFIRGIPSCITCFNIWCFGDSAESLWSESQPYNADTVATALSYVGSFSSDMGGTDLLPALKAITRARQGQGPLDIIVLTDGEVWGIDETVEFVRQARQDSEGAIRFFALGIGPAVSHELVESIAKTGGGYAEVIPAASQDGWEDRVVAVLEAALTSHIGPLQLTWEREHIEENGRGPVAPPSVQTSPFDVSTLSPFLKSRIFILAENNELSFNSNISITTKRLDGTETVSRVPISRLALSDSTIHKFAARALLGDLERGDSWIHHLRGTDRHSLQTRHMASKEGERLGCKWSLVSKWTSFVAVEALEEPDPEPEQVSLDTETPAIEGVYEDGMGLLWQRTDRIPRDAAARIQERAGTDQHNDHVGPEFAADESSHSSENSLEEISNVVEWEDNDNGEGIEAAPTNTSESQHGIRDIEQPTAPGEPSQGPDVSHNIQARARSRQQAITSECQLSESSLVKRSVGKAFASGRVVKYGAPRKRTRLRSRSPSEKSRESHVNLEEMEMQRRWQHGPKRCMWQPPLVSLRPEQRQQTSSQPPQSGSLSSASDWRPRTSNTTASFAKAKISTSPVDYSSDFAMAPSSFTNQDDYGYTEGHNGLLGVSGYPSLYASHSYNIPLPAFSDERHLSGEIRARGYNPPSSSALLDVQPSTAKSEEILRAEAYVRRIVQFQWHDGRFHFRTEEKAEEVLGLEVFKFVDILRRDAFNENAQFELIVTIAIIGLLRAKFSQCIDLWSRVVLKAVEYVQKKENNVWIEGNFDRIKEAEKLASEIKKLPFEEETTDVAYSSTSAERVLLEIAPYI